MAQFLITDTAHHFSGVGGSAPDFALGARGVAHERGNVLLGRRRR